ncbi:MAG: hypothetical protein ACREBF_03215 [Candidatus Micrarchaeales archaeon]
MEDLKKLSDLVSYSTVVYAKRPLENEVRDSARMAFHSPDVVYSDTVRDSKKIKKMDMGLIEIGIKKFEALMGKDEIAAILVKQSLNVNFNLTYLTELRMKLGFDRNETLQLMGLLSYYKWFELDVNTKNPSIKATQEWHSALSNATKAQIRNVTKR